jgi:misacylated tRNA(Ala) deacylase
MTELLYQTDSYRREFEARVIKAWPELHAVTLDATAFYPGGGGQPADAGTLDGLRVSGIRREDGEILHVVDGDLPPAGKVVRGVLDWHRRHQLMRTHTAMHVLCGVVFRDFGALVTGGDMQPLKGRMDFEFPRLKRELVSTIEHSVNSEIMAGREVHVRILPRDEAFRIPDLIRTKIDLLPKGIQEVRIVEIVGLDLQADGGTHVRNTSEVGRVHVSDYKSKGASNKRIYLEVEAG